MRKSCEGFRYAEAQELKKHVSFENLGEHALIYHIKETKMLGNEVDLKIVINPSETPVEVEKESTCIFDENGLCNKQIKTCPGLSVLVFKTEQA